MKKVTMIYIILLFSSCVIMKQELPQITTKLLPSVCSNLHSFLSENWYKHRTKKCHKNTFDVYKFSIDYRECILLLTKKQIIMLFGEPDKITNYGEFQYILDTDCSDNSLRNYHYINFEFKQDSVIDVEGGEISIIE